LHQEIGHFIIPDGVVMLVLGLWLYFQSEVNLLLWFSFDSQGVLCIVISWDMTYHCRQVFEGKNILNLVCSHGYKVAMGETPQTPINDSSAKYKISRTVGYLNLRPGTKSELG